MSESKGSKTQAVPNDIRRWDKASKVVENENVKLYSFLPSGRRLWTVAGREGDYLVDFETAKKPSCSCDDFYFRVLSGKVPECYHLMAARRAVKEGAYQIIDRLDEEYPVILKRLLDDLFSRMA
jgi:predicted nucleic acid-binding Zn finger protein